MKLISLNIEGDAHLNRVVQFLERENPDVICLQELFEKDAELLSKTLTMDFIFSPMTYMKRNNTTTEVWEKMGIGIFSRAPLTNTTSQHYWSPSDTLEKFDNTDVHTKQKTERFILLAGNIDIHGNLYRVATTHFIWTPDGLPNSYQETGMAALLSLLSKEPDVVLCGDFNIPRNHNNIYEKIATRYEDVIPKSYMSSLDLHLHRVKEDPVQSKKLATFMVDYIFLSKKYGAENVHLESGVSDHMAVIGDIAVRK